MPSADKRARKKENARAAREQREAAVKKKKRVKSMTTFGIIGAVFVGLVVILSVAGGDDKKEASKTTTPTSTTTGAPVADPKIDPTKTYTATIETNLGNIGVLLNTKDAPIAAGHFINLANRGVYNGSRWHRIIKDFVIQGGAPGGDPTANYGKSVPGEVPKSGKYQVGDLAAAKTEADPDGTFDSQFYIVTGPNGEALPPQYADFGSVTSGMDVVKKIEALPTDDSDEPKSEATIDKITISTSGGQAGATTSSSTVVAPSVSTSTTAPAR